MTAPEKPSDQADADLKSTKLDILPGMLASLLQRANLTPEQMLFSLGATANLLLSEERAKKLINGSERPDFKVGEQQHIQLTLPPPPDEVIDLAIRGFSAGLITPVTIVVGLRRESKRDEPVVAPGSEMVH